MPTYPLTFPTSPGLEDVSMSLVRKTTVSTSPFTGNEQRSEWPFHLWAIAATVPEIDGDTAAARDWRAFVLELRGQIGTFNLPVPGTTAPSTGYVGTQGVVNGSSQLGESIITNGWTISTPILNRGDYFMIGAELKMCMVDISSDATGNATIVFEPDIVNSPTTLSNITYNNPFVIMRFANDDNTWKLRQPVLHSFEFEAIEVQQ